ncbi:MAG TPA: hypothetical protein VFM05_06340 [Candidatus Saccharimonadales bacterium]|nr:hypothetical protein [Candidatus Saccharimonadales bacterium]
MSSDLILSRLRRFLLGLSALLCVGIVFELWLTKHMENFVQLIPFGLCGLGFLAAAVVLFYPRRAPMLSLRLCMGLVALGGIFGAYEHIENNVGFHREIRPNAPTREIVLASFYGPNPLLAPGILAVAAVLAMAATYHHPALVNGKQG